MRGSRSDIKQLDVLAFESTKIVFMTFKVEGVSNEERGDSAGSVCEAAEWRAGTERWMRESHRKRGNIRKKKYEGSVIPFLLPPAPPAVVLSPFFNHFSLSLICPITPNCLCCPPPSQPRSPPRRLSLSFFLHPHKWLSETGQVLQNSPCSSTCLIQGLIAPRQVIRCLLTERGTQASQRATTNTPRVETHISIHIHHQLAAPINKTYMAL